MMATLSRPVRRVLALGLLIIPPLALYTLVIAPAIDAYWQGREEIEDMRHQSERYAQVARDAGELERRLTALRRATGGHDGYLAGENETLVGAALQLRVKTLIEESGGAVRSSQILPFRDETGVRRITVRLQSTQSTAGLAQALAALASDQSTLMVDQLDVRARPVAQQAAAGPLEVRLDVSGLMRPRTP
jgi:general secretion pathway protein M